MVHLLYLSSFIFLLFPPWLLAGSNIPLSVQSSTSIVLKGTSTLHDYECLSTVLHGVIEMDTLLKSFKSIEISIPVKSIHSGNSSMDENMYDALKANDNPDIKFSLININNDTKSTLVNQDSIIQLQGKLSIAGKEQMIELPVIVVKDNNGIVTVRGKKKLLMTEYGIEPPTFMLGILKTGNEVSVEFKVDLKSFESQTQLIPTN